MAARDSQQGGGAGGGVSSGAQRAQMQNFGEDESWFGELDFSTYTLGRSPDSATPGSDTSSSSSSSGVDIDTIFSNSSTSDEDSRSSFSDDDTRMVESKDFVDGGGNDLGSSVHQQMLQMQRQQQLQMQHQHKLKYLQDRNEYQELHLSPLPSPPRRAHAAGWAGN